ncbi:MAG TPA: glycoside hydrolase family 2 TIM barrel-domain containing protein [Candidatus Didemnitutus sp.]|nr:glycoside hydrolase family 2 TIM barrel-domain containing protein [Candidatus Didemnitutus sp.]
MKSLFVLVFILWCARLGAAAPIALNPTPRRVIDLDGAWKTIVDPYDNGYLDYRAEPYDQKAHPTSGFFLDRKPETKSELLEYNFDSSAELHVPADWNSQDPKLFYYEGAVWYRRTFDYTPKKAGDRVFVYFGGANYQAEVYLNGEKLGKHIGGFTPFQFEITGKVKPAHNSLVVRVENRRAKERVPTVNTDWWNYGGLTRDVMILETPPAYIREYFLQCHASDPGTASGFVQVDGVNQPTPVRVQIPDLKVDAEFTTDASGRAEISVPLKGVELWTPEHPRRYEVSFVAGADRISDRMGFRTIQTRGTDILLNGKPIFLRGISLHEVNPLKGGRACTEEDDRLTLGWAKELGCNFVRLAHYPHNEAMARTAEEMGLLLWEEVPVYWTIQWENPDTYANAANQLTELIERDRNRASVIVWSMANETPVLPARNDFLRREVALARRLDPTRLISAAMEVHGDPADPHVRIIDDPLADSVDLVSFNEYVGWYSLLPDDCPAMQWKVPYQKPVVISEFGGDALQGMHGDRLTRFTEEFQEDLYRQTLPMLARIPQLRGMTPWILCDFRSPRRMLAGIQDGWNRKGLIGSNGEKKKAYFVLQDFYAKKVEEQK